MPFPAPADVPLAPPLSAAAPDAAYAAAAPPYAAAASSAPSPFGAPAADVSEPLAPPARRAVPPPLKLEQHALRRPPRPALRLRARRLGRTSPRVAQTTRARRARWSARRRRLDSAS